ncbi:hypothetical protein AAZX31_06G221400 [Glycine max]|uniref:PGG domain-containing protein n=1 Tax=Glycine max TaxID=3847 RepID=K7KWY9_SOYBN
MNTTREDRSRVNLAAQEGDIDGLYTVIQENPHVLEDIDSIPFVDTPLHVAASVGHLRFVTEVMRLKPSFAWKQNPEGLTPIHLALQHGHDNVVLRLVSINNDLVRAKGRKGRTPLHLASKKGEIDLLTKFLLACPNCIEDVTVKSETALHIAVRCGQFEALQALQLLLKTKVDLKAKNLENSTALDVVTSAEIRNALVKAGAKQGSSVTNAPTLADKLRWNITLMGKITIFVLRIRSDITEDQRQAFLIVAALIATATYQSALSPPGGVFQANAGNNNNNNVNITSLNSTTIATQGINVGTSVISEGDFLTLSIFNSLSLLTSTVTMYILTPSGIVGTILFTPMFWFAYCYLYSIRVISPTNATKYFNLIMLCLFFFLYSGVWWTFSIVYKRLKCHEKKRDIGTRNSTGRNIW